MEEPVFLVGAARSGIALLELMLGAHPSVHWCGEIDFALEWDETQDGEWPPLVPYWQHLATSPRVRARRLLIDPTLAFPALVKSLLLQQRPRSSAEIVGASVHDHYARLVRLWPDARFIYLGSDAALDEDDARSLHRAARRWRSVAAEIPMGRRLEVRYESLVLYPRLELERVCRFLELVYEPAMLTEPVVLRGADGAWLAEAECEALGEAPREPRAQRARTAGRLARSIGRHVARVRAQWLGVDR
jgi:hypothetical protein